MRKFKTLIFTMIIVLSFSACQDISSNTKLPITGIKDNRNEPLIDTLVSPEKMVAENQIIPEDSVLKYYEYFLKNPVPTMLLEHNDDDESGFSDEKMSAFAIYEYSRVDGNFDYVQGTIQENLDTITKKYFDTVVSNYETTFTTILENGNITSTGWGTMPSVYILKEIYTTEIGSKKAVLYKVDPTIGESMEYNQYLDKLLNGQFDDLGEIGLAEFEFFEKIDENGEYYVQFVSAHYIGIATEPWIVYDE